MRKPVTDQDIQALIDGQLHDDDAERVMLYIQEKNWARQRYFELQQQKDSIIKFYRPH
jgi:anti-sigma factor RsiW|tara:strand:+ start:36831 stop:37004 length:174 start_codon:yes stop_codon:yes gene_type:complete